MRHHRTYGILFSWALGVALLVASPARAQEPGRPEVQRVREELDQLRREFEAVRQQYDQRLDALERRLGELGGATAPAGTPAVPAPPPAPPEPVPVATEVAPVPALTPPADVAQSATAPPMSSKVFNPDIAVIGDFVGATGTNALSDQPALGLPEAEASFQAVVDPYAKADFFFSFGPAGVDIEEGYLTFNTLPGDLLLKVGKVHAAFGKVNTMHTHVLPWADRPLVTQNLVGGDEGVSNAGLSVSRLIVNPLLFLEATGEVYHGSDEVFQSAERSRLLYVGRLRGYRDLTESTNLDVGASIARGPTAVGLDTSARLVGVDATFRYRPLRLALYRQLIARTELVWRREDGERGDRPQHAFGMYASGDYQFARRWFAGARYDYSERALDASLSDKGGSLLLTFRPSEFSQVRGQYRRTSYAEGTVANEVLFQFLFSIGAHGAHVF